MHTSAYAFLTFSYLGIAHESMNMTTGLLSYFEALQWEYLFWNCYGFSDFNTETNKDLISAHPAAGALCGDSVELNRWKDGAGSIPAALCPSDQKAR